MKKQLVVLLMALAPAWVFAAGSGIHLDKANIDPNNTQSLQRGARLFVNYCLSCHSASLMPTSVWVTISASARNW